MIKRLRELIQKWMLPQPGSFFNGVEVFRCRSDGQLVTKKSNLENHAGHYLLSPITLSIKEKVLIWLKIIV